MDNKKLNQTICGEQPRHRNSFVSYLLRMFLLLAVMVCGAGNVAWGQDATFNMGQATDNITVNECTLKFTGGGIEDVNTKTGVTTLSTKTENGNKTSASMTLTGQNIRYIKITFADDVNTYNLKWGGSLDETINANNDVSGKGTLILVSNSGPNNIKIINDIEKGTESTPIKKVEVYYWNEGYTPTGGQTAANATKTISNAITWENNTVDLSKINVVGKYASFGTNGKGAMLKNSPDNYLNNYLSIKFEKPADLSGISYFRIDGENVDKTNGPHVFDLAQFICDDGKGGTVNVDKYANPANVDFTGKDNADQRANLAKVKEIRLYNNDCEGTFSIKSIKFIYQYTLTWINGDIPTGCDAWYTIGSDETHLTETSKVIEAGTEVTFHGTDTGDDHKMINGWHNPNGEYWGWGATKAIIVSSDISVKPDFQDCFRVFANAENGATATVNKTGKFFQSVEDLTFSTTVPDGYTFLGWDDGSGIKETANPWNYGKYTPQDGITDLNLTAKFTPNNTLSQPKCNHVSGSNGNNYFDISKLYTNLAITAYSKEDGRTITVPTTGGNMSYFFDDEYNFGDLKSWTISENSELQARINSIEYLDANGNQLAICYTDAGNRTLQDSENDNNLRKKLDKVKEIRINFKSSTQENPITEEKNYQFKWICFTFEHADRVKPVLSEGTATDMRVFTGENLILANGSGFWRQYTDNTYKTVKSDGFIPTNEWVKRYVIPSDRLKKDEDYYFRVVDSCSCALGYQHSSEAVYVHVKVTDPINTVEVNGTTRQYDVYAPEGITSSESSKVGVVISLHGASNDYWNGRVDFNSIAEAEKNNDNKKFVVVYPRGLMRQLRGQERGWETYTESNTEDVEFFKAIVTELKKTYTVDDKRIYLAGFSNGGMMAYKAAHQAADFFAAFASVGGYPVNESHLFHAGKQPTPFIHIQGKADGIFPNSTYPLDVITHNMVYRNGAKFNPWTEDTYETQDGGMVTSPKDGEGNDIIDKDCHAALPGGAAFYMYKVAGMGHTWTYDWDGDHVDDVAATMWKFFNKDGIKNSIDQTLKFRINDSEFWSRASDFGFDNVNIGTSVLSYGGRRKTGSGSDSYDKDTNNNNIWHSLQFQGGINGVNHYLKMGVSTEQLTEEQLKTSQDYFMVKLVQVNPSNGAETKVFSKRYQTGKGSKPLYINFAALPGLNEYKLYVTKSNTTSDFVKINTIEFHSGLAPEAENPQFYAQPKLATNLGTIYQPVYGASYDGQAKEYLAIANIPLSDLAKDKDDQIKVNGTAIDGPIPAATKTPWENNGQKGIMISTHESGSTDANNSSVYKSHKANNLVWLNADDSHIHTVNPTDGLCISEHGKAEMQEYLDGTKATFPDHGVVAFEVSGTVDFILIAQNKLVDDGSGYGNDRRYLKAWYKNNQSEELHPLIVGKEGTNEWFFNGSRNELTGDGADLSGSIRLQHLGSDGKCYVFLSYESTESDQNVWIKGMVVKRPDLRVTIGRTDSKYADESRGEETENTELTRYGENRPYIWDFQNVGFNNTAFADQGNKKYNKYDWRTYVCGTGNKERDHLLVYSEFGTEGDYLEKVAQFDGRVHGQEHIEFLNASQYTMKEPGVGRTEFNPIHSNGIKVNVTGSGWFKIKASAPNGPVKMKVYSSTNYGITYTNLLREFIVDNSKHPASATGQEEHRWGEYTVYLKGHVELKKSTGQSTQQGFWDGEEILYDEDKVKDAEEKVRMSLYIVYDEIEGQSYIDNDEGIHKGHKHAQLNIHQLSWLNEEPADYVFQREEDPKLLTEWQAIRRDEDGNKTLDDSTDDNVVLWWKAGNDDDANYTVLKGHANGSYNVINQVNTDDAAKGVKSPGSYASTSVPSDAGTYDAYWDIAAPARVNALVEKAYGDNAKKTDTQYAYSSGNNTEFDTPVSGSFIRISAMKNTYVVAHVIPGNTSVSSNATPHSGATVYVLDETGNPIPSSSSDANASRLGYIAAMVNGGSAQNGGVASQDKTIRIDFVANAGKEYFICANGASISLARLEVHNWRNWTHKPTKAETLELTDNADNSLKIETAYETGNYYRDATLTRTFAAGKWASLVLPFSLNEQKFKEVFGENAKCIHFTDVDTKNNVVKLTHHYYNMIVAGRPVFIYTPKQVVNPQFKDITLQTKDVKNTTTESGFTFHASYDGTQMKWNDLYMNNANAIKYVSNDKSKQLTYPGMRSFIQSPNGYDPSDGRAGSVGAKAVFLSFLDDDYQDIPTGIEELISAEFGEDVVVVTKTTKIYDLLGNVMGEGSDINSLPAGIYIVNGKKYIVK